MLPSLRLCASLLGFSLAASTALAQTGPGSSAWLTFELGAPCEIANAVAASNEYAAEGVTFVGATPGAGPVILRDCGSLGFDAYRGQGLIVSSEFDMSQSGPAGGPITMLFSPPADRLTFRSGSAIGSGTYEMTFYSGATSLLSSSGGTFGWMLFSLSPGEPFDRVVIERRFPDESAWGIDEVSVVRTGASIGNILCDQGSPFQGIAVSLMAAGSVTGGGPFTELTFSAVGGPRNGLGILLASQDGSYHPVPGGVSYLGQLCVRTPILRIGLLQFDPTGAALAPTSLAPLPGPLVGETWYFQGWHRFDSPYFFGSTGLTNSIEIEFQ